MESWKPKVLSAPTHTTYLNPLDENQATKAESFTSSYSLYSEHPFHEIDFEIKEKMDFTISDWYTECHISHPLKTVEP